MASQIPAYDYIVIGSGLSGLFTATLLSQQTTRVLLVDESEQFGGSHRSVPHECGALNASLQFFPWTKETEIALLRLEEVLGLKLIKSVVDNPILTYEKGEFSPFIGFGNHAPEFFTELSPFLAAKRIELHFEWGEIIQLLREKFKGDLVQKNVVTGFDFDKNIITGVTLNGGKKVNSTNVVYCGNLKRLYPLITLNPEVSGRTKAKLSKGPYWSVLRLDFLFAREINPGQQLYLLTGASQDDVTPCIGRFFEATDKGQASQWMTFLPALEAEESELVGEAMKKIKRQLKRSFFSNEDSAEFQKTLIKERITLHEYQYGGDIKLDDQFTLPGTQGLWVGSSQLSVERGPLAGVIQGMRVLQSMGFATNTIQNLFTEQSL